MQLDTPRSSVEDISNAEEESRRLDHPSTEDGVDLIQVVLLLWRNKKTILTFSLGTGVLAALIAFFVMKPIYTADAVFLPPQSTPGSAAGHSDGP